MKTLLKQIEKKYPDPFHEIAKYYDTPVYYVRLIASGERTPTKGKGLKILKKLEKIARTGRINNNQKSKI